MQLVGVAATATGWPFKLMKTLRVAPFRHEYAGSFVWKSVT